VNTTKPISHGEIIASPAISSRSAIRPGRVRHHWTATAPSPIASGTSTADQTIAHGIGPRARSRARMLFHSRSTLFNSTFTSLSSLKMFSNATRSECMYFGSCGHSTGRATRAMSR
jgi:hypothetical protein